MNKRPTDEQLLSLLRQVDIQAMRIPSGVRKLADLICEQLLQNLVEYGTYWEDEGYKRGKAERNVGMAQEFSAPYGPFDQETERLVKDFGNACYKAGVAKESWEETLLEAAEVVRTTHTALVVHIQRGTVPEGWQVVPKEPTPEMIEHGSDELIRPGTAGHRTAWTYAAMLAAAPDHFRDTAEMVPDQFRDATKMMAQPAEVPMPEPDTHCHDEDERRDVWSHSTDQMRTYGDAREAAGYARGLAEGVARTGLTPAEHDVLAERQRQISAEGWTPDHDDEHSGGAMAAAAGCYALFSDAFPTPGQCPPQWPWEPAWWKPSSYRRDLVKAAALLLAEIERLDRAALRGEVKP